MHLFTKKSFSKIIVSGLERSTILMKINIINLTTGGSVIKMNKQVSGVYRS